MKKKTVHTRSVRQFQRCNIYVIGRTEGKERHRAKKKIEVIMVKNFSKLMIDTKPQIQKAQKIISKTNRREKNSIIFKLQSTKGKEKKYWKARERTKEPYL